MERLSEIIWARLNRFIGCEEEVHIRRRIFLVQDAVRKGTIGGATHYSSGSRAEGLEFANSDYDFMIVENTISILPNVHCNMSNAHFVMETGNTKPGFARFRLIRQPTIRIVTSEDINSLIHLFNTYLTPGVFAAPIFSTMKVRSEEYIRFNNIPSSIRYRIISFPFTELASEALTVQDNQIYLSSLLYLNKHVELTNERMKCFIHGPCATYKNERDGTEVDILSCCRCSEWPDVANEWQLRNRPNDWPRSDLIKDILEDGILLVPIGNPQSPTSHLEWRLSFSLAEKRLVHSMNHTQFLCYGLLKLYLKQVIDSQEDVKGLLCSYFLKTSVFYCMEDEFVVWEKHNLLGCFWTCLKRILIWVRDGYCPNFFVKSNNMFEHKIRGDDKRKLADCLMKLYNDGNKTLMKIAVLSNLSLYLSSNIQMPMYECEMNDYLDDIEKEYRFDRLTLLMPLFGFIRPLHNLWAISSVRDQCLLSRVDLDILSIMEVKSIMRVSEHLYHLAVNGPNKTRYKRLTLCRNYIQQVCKHGDITTGWLQLATLCYLNGNYKYAIHIAEHILTKFKPFVLEEGRNFNREREMSYIAEMCNRGMTVLQKIRKAISYPYTIDSEYNLYPQEIEPELFFGIPRKIPAHIPPSVYTRVLLFLSYNALGWMELRDEILNQLRIRVNFRQFRSEFVNQLFAELYNKCRRIARH